MSSLLDGFLRAEVGKAGGPDLSAPAAAIFSNGASPAAASGLESRVSAEGAGPQARRILPDLSREEPFEALLREKGEERVSARRQPRRRNAEARAAARLDAKQGTRRKRIVEEGASIPVGAAPAREPGITAPDATKARGPVAHWRRALGASAARARRRGTRRLPRSWADRVADRRARRRGLPVRLRAGERWKRRLPPACW